MAVREFDGTDDRILVDNGAIGQLANGAFTLLVVCKPASKNAGEAYISVQHSSGSVATLFDNGGTQAIATGDDSYYDGPNSGGLTSGSWFLLGVKKASGSAQPQYYCASIGGTANWTGAGTNWAGNTSTATEVEFGSLRNGSFSSFRDFRLAVGAVFNKALTEGEMDGIATAKTTQSIYDLTPQGLWDFNQAAVGTSVTDLMGNGADQTAITGTTVINGDDPSGWTFGIGGGGGAPAAKKLGTQGVG